MTMTRQARPIVLALTVYVGSSWLHAAGVGQDVPAPDARTGLAVQSPDEETAYLCPMHPDYTSGQPGTCPRCSMALVLGTPFDMRAVRLDFQTIPQAVVAGVPARLLFRAFHPGSGALLRKFELVHEQPYHVFVISQDLAHFFHIHPEQRPDGTWSVDVTLPEPGAYKVLSDFMPSGGSGQFIGRSLITAGYAGDLAAPIDLEPDRDLRKTVDDITAEVRYDPDTLIAGSYGHLRYHLTDTRTGEVVRDLQTYLGAFGHSLIVSEDLVDYVHSHPVEPLPVGVNLETVRGGPDVEFEGLMPRPGRYRVWTQFRRNGRLHTFMYTFSVVDIGDLARQ